MTDENSIHDSLLVDLSNSIKDIHFHIIEIASCCKRIQSLLTSTQVQAIGSHHIPHENNSKLNNPRSGRVTFKEFVRLYPVISTAALNRFMHSTTKLIPVRDYERINNVWLIDEMKTLEVLEEEGHEIVKLRIARLKNQKGKTFSKGLC